MPTHTHMSYFGRARDNDTTRKGTMQYPRDGDDDDGGNDEPVHRLFCNTSGKEGKRRSRR